MLVGLLYSAIYARSWGSLTIVVRADLMGLVSSHNQPNLLRFLVLQQLDITSTTFLPLAGVAIKLEKLCSPTLIGVRMLGFGKVLQGVRILTS